MEREKIVMNAPGFSDPLQGINDDIEADSTLTIEQQIMLRERELHRIIRVPPPAECQRIWDLAIAHTVPVIAMFLVDIPLKPAARGALNGSTGEIWVYYPGKEALKKTLITELHEIAHVVRQSLSIARKTIDEYWNEERETYRTAYALAQEWAIPQFFCEEELETCLEKVEYLRDLDHGIASLIGNNDPKLVRIAYTEGLLPMICAWKWDLDRLMGAIQGWDPSEEHFAALMDFNRSCLRSTWIGSSNRGETMDFGPLGLDLSPTSAHLLFTTLQQTSEMGLQEEPSEVIHKEQAWSALTIDDSYTLTQALLRVNSALLAYRDDALRVRWLVYGDRPDVTDARVYRISLSYEGNGPKRSQDIWLLFGFYTTADLQLEAAWQRYMLSWQQEIRQLPLREGLLLFWSLLGGRQVEQ